MKYEYNSCSGHKYVQFPISMLQNFLDYPQERLVSILHFGLYYFSTKIPVNNRAVAEQFVYWEYRGKVPASLRCEIEKHEWNYLGTLNGSEAPVQSGSEMWEPEFVEVENTFASNSELERLATEYYQFIQAAKILGLKRVSDWFDKGRALYLSAKQDEPMPTISIPMLTDFLNHQKSKSEFEQLVSYLAVRSILGKKPHCITNKNHIRARMFGFRSANEVPPDYECKNKLYKKYRKRYHIDNLLELLKDHWHVKTYSNKMRGMVIAIGDETTYDHLVSAALARNRKHKRNKRQREIRLAEERALKLDLDGSTLK